MSKFSLGFKYTLTFVTDHPSYEWTIVMKCTQENDVYCGARIDKYIQDQCFQDSRFKYSLVKVEIRNIKEDAIRSIIAYKVYYPQPSVMLAAYNTEMPTLDDDK